MPRQAGESEGPHRDKEADGRAFAALLKLAELPRIRRRPGSQPLRMTAARSVYRRTKKKASLSRVALA